MPLRTAAALAAAILFGAAWTAALAAADAAPAAPETAQMRPKAALTARVAPHAQAPACAALTPEDAFAPAYVAPGWYGFHSPKNRDAVCWAPVAEVEPLVRTRGAALAVPLLIDAGRAVVTFLRDLFTGDLFKKKAEFSLKPGTMASVLEEKGGKARIRTDDGREGWIAREALAKIQSFAAAPAADQGIWQGHEAAESGGDLLVEVWVTRPDGAPVPNGGALRLGDEYEVHVRCSKDCHLRVTCETPAAGAACQYSPNPFPGHATSPRIPAGADAWPYLLPPGMRFRVSEPVLSEDILLVEAISADLGRPFRYVAGTDKGEGCASVGAGATTLADGSRADCATRGGGFSRAGCGFRGGGFSTTPEGLKNPVPEVASRFTIQTLR